MTKTKRKETSMDAGELEAPPWAPWLTQIAFALTLMLVIARGMMTETVREGFDVTPQSSAAPAGPGPATTLALDVLCCVPALLVLGRRVADREYVLRWTWSQALFAALAAWAACSVIWSTDKFVTAIAAANTIAAASLIWSTAQLVRSWLRLRIVAGVCFGLLLVYLAQGMVYHFVEAADNVRYWRDNKQDILRERGWTEGSFEALQFEKKLTSGEMIGFNQSPNSFAAVIVMLMVISTGSAIQRRAHGDGIGWPIVILLTCSAALMVLYFTGSRTSAGTLVIAAGLLALLGVPRIRGWAINHSAAAYAIAAAVVLCGATALIGHGVYHGSLPQDSLNFRWRYWVAAAKLVRQHPLAGVGWGNFGPHYLAVRAAAAAEEIRDPHNFIVRAFAELGVLGGLITLAWLARAARDLTRPVTPPRAKTPDASKLASATGFALLLTILIGGVLLNSAVAIDWSQKQAFLILETFRRVLALGLLCVGAIVIAVRSTKAQELDDRPAPWLLYGVIAGLGVFFVHNLIDFVLAEAGPLTIFAVVLGAATGIRTPSVAGSKKRRGVAIAALAVGAIVCFVATILLVIPVADAEQRARDADDVLRNNRPDLAAGLLRNCFQEVSYNADYAFRASRALMLAGAPAEEVKAMLDMAIGTDPSNVMFYLTRANFELHQPTADSDAVRADFDKALARDPNNLAARVEYADTLAKLNDPKAAAAQYRAALQTNAGYDITEPKRLRPDERKRIEEAIAKLGG
jgi:O-antigen ligase